MLTTPYVFNEDEAQAMTSAGAEMVVAHKGLTTGGTIGATVAMALNEAIDTTMRIAEAARKRGISEQVRKFTEIKTAPDQ